MHQSKGVQSMKKFRSLAACILCILVLAACQPVSPAEQSNNGTPANTPEEFVEQTIPSDTDVTVVWPADRLPDTVPPIPRVAITDVAETDSGIRIGFKECDQDITEEYLGILQDSGWKLRSHMDIDGSDSAEFSFAEQGLGFSWAREGGTGLLLWDMSREQPSWYELWPSDRLPDNIPVLDLTVTYLSAAERDALIVFEGCTQTIADGFVAQMQANGWGIRGYDYDGETVEFISFDEIVSFRWHPADGTGAVSWYFANDGNDDAED